MPIFIVGNKVKLCKYILFYKVDLEKEYRAVPYQQAVALAMKLNTVAYETSTDSLPVRLDMLKFDKEGNLLDSSLFDDKVPTQDSASGGVREVYDIFLSIVKRAKHARALKHEKQLQLAQQQQAALQQQQKNCSIQ